MAVWSRLLAVAGFAALAICLSACRDDSAAAVSYTEDLGTDARPLPPPSSPVMIAKIREGTAELPPLRNPTEVESADDSDAAPAEGEGEGAPAGDGGAEGAAEGEYDAAAIEQEIRQIVKDYNEYATKFEFEELTNFYVTSQQELAGRANAATKKSYDRLNALCAKIVEAKPDAKERVEAVRAKMYKPEEMELVLTSLEVTGPKSVNVKMRTPFPALQDGVFRLLGTGDEANWYLEVPGMTNSPLIERMIEASEMDPIMKPIREGLESGAITADVALVQLEAMAETTENMRKVLEQAAAGELDDANPTP
jgi:hypothetical protein